jgi:hypothetical protein
MSAGLLHVSGLLVSGRLRHDSRTDEVPIPMRVFLPTSYPSNCNVRTLPM